MKNSMIYEHSYKEQYVLQEFRFTPLGLKPYTVYNNKNVNIPPLEIYSSERIVKRALDIFSKSDITKPIIDLIEKGLNNKKIIVGYTNPSKFKFLYSKIEKLLGIKRTWGVGFFDKIDNVTYIVLDDNVDIFGNSIVDLPLILVHELCHMAGTNNKDTKLFQKTSSKILIPFYSNFIFYLITRNTDIKAQDIKITGKELEDVLFKLFKYMEIEDTFLTSNTLDHLADIWNKFFEKHFTKKYKFIGDNLINLYFDRFMKGEDSNKTLNDEISLCLILAYGKIGKRITNQYVGQEVVFITEVISTVTEDGLRSEILNAIKQIKMD